MSTDHAAGSSKRAVKRAAESVTASHGTSDSQSDRAIQDFQTFASFIFSVSIFGASTFSVIASQMADPADIWGPEQRPPFSLRTVRTFLAISWLCFVLSLALAGYSLSIMTLLRQQAGGQLTKAALQRWEMLGVSASVLLHHLIVVAFMFLALSLAAYAGVAGWVAVGFTALALAFVVLLSAHQLIKYFSS